VAFKGVSGGEIGRVANTRIKPALLCILERSIDAIILQCNLPRFMTAVARYSPRKMEVT
jgi:hypothetical protein